MSSGSVFVEVQPQTLSLISNSLEISDGNSVDLSQYLDNTDDQVITQFAVVGPNVVLSLEDGNTVTVPVADFQDGTGTDDQLLSLVGNNLSIENGNTIDLSQFEEILTVTTRDVYVEEYAGRSSNGTTQLFARNATMTRTAAGRWTVVLSPAHPDGVNYAPKVVAEEQSNTRDTPDITVVQGSISATGFQIQITTGDNGGVADTYVDTPWTWSVNSPVTLIETATLT